MGIGLLFHEDHPYRENLFAILLLFVLLSVALRGTPVTLLFLLLLL